MTQHLEDTIVAIATPLGTGGIGVVRLSGPAALEIAKACLPDGKELPPRQVCFSTVHHPQTKALLDEGCVVYFQGPASYTGEDVIEFQVHSGTQLLQSIVQACLTAGARLAERGEFTRRAFMHGKMDLTKAEAVIDLMEATSPTAQSVALGHLEGRLLSHIISMRDKLMHTLEQVEGSIDFPEEVPEINHEAFAADLSQIESQLSEVLSKQDFGEAIRTGVKVVIIGRPNVGKSSLMNQLLGQERAIVTPIPGTTRDYIEGQFNYGGLTFHLYDTAGLREDTADVIEQLGMEKIQELIQKAHLIFWVVDGSQNSPELDLPIFERLSDPSRVCLLVNKSDQEQAIDLSAYPSAVSKVHCHTQDAEGIQPIKDYLDQTVVSELDSVDLDWVCNLRQQSVLQSLLDDVRSLKETLVSGYEDDMLATDLKKAVSACHELTGHEITELVLDGVFSRFCVGK